MQTFSAKEVSNLSGATLRQLQVWDENAVLVASRGKRGYRVYSEHQMEQAKRLMQVRHKHTFKFGEHPKLTKQILNTSYPILVIKEATVVGGILVVPV